MQGKETLWQQKNHCSKDEVALLQSLLQEYLFEKTELQHIHRIQLQLKKCIAASHEKQKGQRFKALQAMAEEKRAYTLHQNASVGRELLLFERLSNMRIRFEQNELLQAFALNQASNEQKGLVMQLIMGAGKTKVIALLLVYRIANGERIATFVFLVLCMERVKSILQNSWANILAAK